MAKRCLVVAIELGDSYARCALAGDGIEPHLLAYIHNDNLTATKIPTQLVLPDDVRAGVRFAFDAHEEDDDDDDRPENSEETVVHHLRRLLFDAPRKHAHRLACLTSFTQPGDMVAWPTPGYALQAWFEHLLKHVVLPAVKAHSKTHSWSRVHMVMPPCFSFAVARTIQIAWADARRVVARTDKITPHICSIVSDTSATLHCLDKASKEETKKKKSPAAAAAAAEEYQLTLIVSSGSCTTSISVAGHDAGTTDVYEVNRADSCHELGGVDVDNAIAAHLLEQMTPVALADKISQSTHALRAFRSQCRRLKHMLCPNGVGKLEPFASLRVTTKELGPLLLELDAATFERVLEPLAARLDAFLSASIREALAVVAVGASTKIDVSRVLLMGGNMQLSTLRKRACSLLETHPQLRVRPENIAYPGKGVVPSEYIREPSDAFPVLGAAHTLLHEHATTLVLDVAPFDLALVVADAQGRRTLAPLLARNQTIPSQRQVSMRSPKGGVATLIELVSDGVCVFRERVTTPLCLAGISVGSHLDQLQLELTPQSNNRAAHAIILINLWDAPKKQPSSSSSSAALNDNAQLPCIGEYS